jgi:hypothetical protein
MAQSSREIYWSAVLADFRRSGMTHVQFCSARRISLHSFRTWLYRLRPGLSPRHTHAPRTSSAPSSPATPGPPPFLPVHVRPGPPAIPAGTRLAAPAPPLELVVLDRYHLRVPAGFDPASLHRLLDALERRP